jgi:hypothetical protein
VKKPQPKAIAILLAAGIIGGALTSGCARKDARQEVVATVNGEDIKVVELREKLGAPGGLFAVTTIPLERKREALDRLVAGRLMAQDARSRGIDNTSRFREILRQHDSGARIDALLRKEVEGKVKLDDGDKDVQEEVAKLHGMKDQVSDADVLEMAKKKVANKRIRKIREELIVIAKKETGAAVDQRLIDRIGKGESVQDNAVLASAWDEKVLYGDVKKILQKMSQSAGSSGTGDPSKDPAMIAIVVDRELTGIAFAAYAKKQMPDRSDFYKAARQALERNILMSMVADDVVSMIGTISDKEIEDAYNEQAGEMIRNGKKIPLSAVKEKIRAFLQNEKRRKALDAYIAELQKKAKITVNDAVLTKG